MLDGNRFAGCSEHASAFGYTTVCLGLAVSWPMLANQCTSVLPCSRAFCFGKLVQFTTQTCQICNYKKWSYSMTVLKWCNLKHIKTPLCPAVQRLSKITSKFICASFHSLPLSVAPPLIPPSLPFPPKFSPQTCTRSIHVHNLKRASQATQGQRTSDAPPWRAPLPALLPFTHFSSFDHVPRAMCESHSWGAWAQLPSVTTHLFALRPVVISLRFGFHSQLQVHWSCFNGLQWSSIEVFFSLQWN